MSFAPACRSCTTLILLITVITVSRTFAQRTAGDKADIDPLFLIDPPVAGILPTTSGSVETYLYPDGGVLAGVVYGLRKNLNVGLYFGGTRVIGSGSITWDNLPGLMVRYRLFEESKSYPAVVAGFDSQGRDGYIPHDRQYAVKSPGIFVCASKNYMLLGSISFHGGIDYTLERADKDFSPNMYIGMEKTIGPLVSFLGEYNFSFDNDKDRIGFWNGAMNIGFRVSTYIGFNIDIYLKNLLLANPYYHHVMRELKIQYVRYF